MKNKSVLILYFFIIFIVGLFAIILKAYSNENIMIEVSNTKVKSIPIEHSFVGVNWVGDKELYRYIYTNPSNVKSLAATIKKANIDIIRYPGGNNILQSFWDVPTADIYTALKKLLNENPDVRHIYRPSKQPSDRFDFKSFLEFCKENNFKATMQVSTHTYFDKNTKTIIPLKTYKLDNNNQKILNTGVVNWKLIDEAAKYAGYQVKWVKENRYSDYIKYWEIGNEEFARVHLNVKYSGDEYGKLAAKFIKEMKKADPSIKIILTNSVAPESYSYSHLNNWSKDVLNNLDIKQCKNDIFAVSSHFYPYGTAEKDFSYSALVNNIYNNPDIDLTKLMELHKNILNNSGYKDTVIFLNEFNSNWFLNPFTYSWLGALGNAKMIMSCANSPYCYHADYHNLMHVNCTKDDGYENKGFGMIHFAKYFQIPFIMYPVGNVIALLNENIKGNVLKTGSNSKGVYTITTLEGDKIKVVILNTGEASINLNFKGFSNLSYTGNKSLGLDVPDKFVTIQEGDSCSNPSEIKLLNVVDNAIKVNYKDGKYMFNLPKNILTVLYFQKNGNEHINYAK